MQGSDPVRQQLELNIQDVFDFAWPRARADVLESVLVQRVPVKTAGDAIGFDAIGHSNLFWVSAQLMCELVELLRATTVLVTGGSGHQHLAKRNLAVPQTAHQWSSSMGQANRQALTSACAEFS